MLTQNINSATTYTLNASDPVTGCYYNDMASIVVSPSPLPTQLANNADSRTYLVAGNNWVVFTAPGTNRAIASIHPNNQNLGWVTFSEFINGNTQNVQACGTDPMNQPQFTTAVLGRNWVWIQNSSLAQMFRFVFILIMPTLTLLRLLLIIM